MAKFKCKCCGAPLDVQEGNTVVTCEFCGSKQTVANADDDRKENLYNRANSLRAACDFDKATLSYQSILSIFPNEAEAHWGLALCKYGIEYVDDPVSRKKVPTIHRLSYESILKDSDYLAALTYADVVAKEEYQEEAKQIADIQRNILSISQKEEPFDIFICYKETNEVGKRTHDSVLAQEIYSNLTDRGYKVFFARITLESKLGSMYEPYIFAALNSAKIMLVVGTKKEHFEAIWVRNEWSRFIDMMKTRPDHYLIPCYKDIDAYEMPEQFLAFQGQDMAKLGFMQDLLRGIDKIMGRTQAPASQAETKIIQTDVNISALLKRSEILISDGDFEKADEVLERVLDNDPMNSQAYLYKLLIDFRLRTVEELKTLSDTFETNGNYKKAYDFGDEQQKKWLSSLIEFIRDRNQQARFGRLYDAAMAHKNVGYYEEAQAAFSAISGYRDAARQALECANLAKERIYSKAVELRDSCQFEDAIELFESIRDYKDSEYQISQCEELNVRAKYDNAMELKEKGMYDHAIMLFKEILTFQDAEIQITECERLKLEAKKEAIYKACLFNGTINPYYDSRALRKACEQLATIPGYKDSDQLLARYEGILKEYDTEQKRKREEAARVRAEKARKTKKISLISVSSSLVIITTLLLTFLFFVPNGRQDNIQNLINSGDYEEALSLIQKNGNFGETAKLEKMCKAGIAFKNLDYKTGVDYIYNIGGSVDVAYDSNGGTVSKTSETIKKSKKHLDNNVEKLGYDFRGWLLTDYTIDSKSYYASINLAAQYKVITYTISYDLKGGKSEAIMPTSYTVEHSFDIPNPTRTGYTFLGWLGTDLSKPTVNLSIGKGTIGNKEYYANWQANDYNVTLDPNGGSVSESSINVQYGYSYTLPVPTRSGYTFDGWYDGSTKLDDTGMWVYPNDMALVAHWNIVHYSITYVLDGGTNNASNPSTYTVEDNISLKNPTKTGYTFQGWYVGSIKKTSILAGTTGDLTLYAHWNNGNSYVVTLNPNGGSVSKASVNVQYDQSYTLPAPTRLGYTFDGWYDGSIIVNDAGTWNYASNKTLVAHWTIINYKINYILDEGSNIFNPSTYTVIDNISLLDPSRWGYTFLGWFDENDNQVISIVSGTTGELTLIARWNDGNDCVVVLDPNGGNVSETMINVQYDHPYELPVPTRPGYTFDGWYLDDDELHWPQPITGTWHMAMSDVVLSAEWTAINYEIDYNLNGGTNDSSNPSSYTIEDSVTFADPFREGYTFIGWYCNDEAITGIPIGSTGNVNIEARWSGNLQSLSVTSEDELKGNVDIISGTGYSGESITVVATPIDNWVFKGWYHNSIKVSSDRTYTFTMPTHDYSLVAYFYTEAEENEELIRLGCIPNLSPDGKTVTYGLYPQKIVSDTSLVSALDLLTSQASNGWYYYNGDYYAKLCAKPYFSNYTFDNGTAIVYGTSYWFKCEPIVWNVLSNSYVISNVLLDSHNYCNSTTSRTIDGKSVLPSNYQYSDIRSWLNNDFYNSAFALENGHIQTTTVYNRAGTTNEFSGSLILPSWYYSDNTNDKVYLPSYKDYRDSNYGFTASTSATNESRFCKLTDWARARGAYIKTQDGNQANNGGYWTRSPYIDGLGRNDDCVNFIPYWGGITYTQADNASIGVRPAITLNYA